MGDGFRKLPLRHEPLSETERDDRMWPELSLRRNESMEAGAAPLDRVESLRQEKRLQGRVVRDELPLHPAELLDRRPRLLRRAGASNPVLEAARIELRARAVRRDPGSALCARERRPHVVPARRRLRRLDEEIRASARVVGDRRQVIERVAQLDVVPERARDLDAQRRRLPMPRLLRRHAPQVIHGRDQVSRRP